MKIMASSGQGFTIVPTIIEAEAQSRYDLKPIGRSEDCRDTFYAITAERRISNSLVTTITESARANLTDTST